MIFKREIYSSHPLVVTCAIRGGEFSNAIGMTAGTDLYMPPEAYTSVAQRGSRRPRDIWIFGVQYWSASF